MAKFPWQLILRQMPTLMSAAGDLLTASRSLSSQRGVGSDLQALRDRLSKMLEDQPASAEVVKGLSDQLNALALAARATDARAQVGLVLGIVGIGVGVAALAVSLWR